MQPSIEHVSDTALLVAACRAMETERPDGFVRDPFAARLAGERGMAIAKSMSGIGWMQFAMGLRARFIDELLAVAIAAGVDTVLNLGAGLDTRPWRLDLPPNLRWIEVDFPAMLEYKTAALGDAKPHCRVERMSADLNNDVERTAVLERARGGIALLITEGLLMYLPAATVQALATEARGTGGFRFWMLDSSSTELMRQAHGIQLDSINRVRDENHLEGAAIREVVERSGWTAFERRTYLTDGARIGAKRAIEIIEADGGHFDPAAPRPADDGSGVWLYRSEL